MLRFCGISYHEESDEGGCHLEGYLEGDGRKLFSHKILALTRNGYESFSIALFVIWQVHYLVTS